VRAPAEFVLSLVKLLASVNDGLISFFFFHPLHVTEGSLNGSVVGPAGVRVDQLSDEVFDYLFAVVPEDKIPVSSGIPVETLKRIRTEFEYFYPMDLRVSGKDLVPNHLTFSIYNHVAIWDEQYWPRGMRSNGHLLLDSKKMSKSTGNFMTLRGTPAFLRCIFPSMQM
jgi:leucyl-tRNA synthetase